MNARARNIIRAAFAMAILAAAASGQSYDGWLDQPLSCSAITGWAWDGTQPNTPIFIDILDGITPIATVQANIFRQDLLNAGKGNGVHGFSFPTPRILKDNKTHQLLVRFSGTLIAISYEATGQLTCSPSGGYQYYYSDFLSSIDANKWYQNTSGSTLTASANGLTSADPNGGSLISKVAVPDGTNEYEVKTTITLAASGGSYYTYLHAATNALAGPVSQGTTYAFELQNPTFSGARCTAILAGYKIISGSVTTYGSTTVPCHSGMTMRVVYKSGGSQVGVYIDNFLYGWPADSTIQVGQPGVGVRNAPAGNYIAQVQLGPLDRVVPNAVPASGIVATALPDHVDLRWDQATDDGNGTGVAYYQILKGGVYLDQYEVPGYTDHSVQPGTTYTYQVLAFDFHFNYSAQQSITVTTPPAGSVDTRRVGIRPVGTYFGGMGENIDVMSGNLNYSIPLVKARGRGNWGVGFNLSYNSQTWRGDGNTSWNLGADIGYGYGWTLQAGMLRPYWSTFMVLDHYEFTDATGATYRLDRFDGTYWWSKDSIYIAYDPATNRLYFPDGSFWVFGCTSAATEQDAGAMYPTLMQDANGNQVTTTYMPGINALWNNSSGRVAVVEDVRAVSGGWNGQQPLLWTYEFNYNTDTIPHLTSITNSIGTAESYQVVVSGLQTLMSPFDGTILSSSYLTSVTYTGVGLKYQFQTDAYGELTKVTLPYGGSLRWGFDRENYSGSRAQREVEARWIWDGIASSELYYWWGHETPTSSRTVHSYTVISDPDYKSRKEWYFTGSGSNAGLLAELIRRDAQSWAEREHDWYTWSQDTAQNWYISRVITGLENGSGSQQFKQTTQALDGYGNVTDIYQYDWQATQSFGSWKRHYVSTYGSYPALNIRNLLLTSTVTDGTKTTTLVSNTYDVYGLLTDLPNVREHDSTRGTSFGTRGNVTSSTTPAGTTSYTYDIGGNVLQTTVNGHLVSTAPTSTTNYAAPSSITASGFTTNLSYSSFLGLTNETGPNGDSASVSYDTFGRPSTTTSPYGATTTVSYAMPPSATVTTTTTPAIGQETHWTRNTLDGFGRAIKAESGHGSTTVSVVDTVYGPCGCSPMGKMMKVSMPHAPNATAVWTVYTYDALGRTLSVTAPDGSAKTYSYTANTVTATDEAGKWKTYAMDAFGNLATVVEPNPAGGTFSTTYAYDFLNHLTTVTMPRPTGTQTRTFNYGNPPGARLMSATNPETGTVTYTYNADGTVATKTDAIGQQVQYSYDTYGRMTQVRHYILNYLQQRQEDTCQQVNLTYDSNSAGGYYLAGRLATRSFKTCMDPNLGAGGALTTSFTEMFSYHQAGAVVTKRLHVERQVPRGAPYNDQVTAAQDLDGNWAYDKEGKMTSVTYPSSVNSAGQAQQGASYTFGFDSMQRPNTMTDVQNGNAQIVTGVLYGPAGELLSISGQYTETRSYNSRLQLTSLNGTTFNYPTNGTNNGKISSEAVSGETISYQYDSLNRLISAYSNLNWGQGFVYDGFGNLTQKTVLAGSVPTFSTGIDPATNRLVGWTYDANGNQITTSTARLTYDVENRITWSTTGAGYGYDPDNRRVYRSSWTSSGGTWASASEEITYYGTSGQRMASYSLTATADSSGGHMKLITSNLNVYFGSRLIGKSASNDGSARTTVTQDRLKSVGKYYPYGEDRGVSNPVNGTDKFATYFRDDTGLDYAMNRYYNSVSGRFMTPDGFKARTAPGDAATPSSWNKYNYVSNDPIKHNDPEGRLEADPDCWVDGVYVCGVSGGGGGGCEFGYHFDLITNNCEPDLTAPDPTYEPAEACSDWGCMPSAFARAMEALTLNRDCLNLFGTAKTRAGKWDPTAVLTSLFFAQDGTYGSVNFNYTGNGAALTTPSGFPTPSVTQGIQGSSATVSINSYNWNIDNVPYNAETLLHELGHVYNFIRGSGNFAVSNLAEAVDSEAFDKVIKTKCNL